VLEAASRQNSQEALTPAGTHYTSDHEMDLAASLSIREAHEKHTARDANCRKIAFELSESRSHDPYH
jgi:hypothetical protein